MRIALWFAAACFGGCTPVRRDPAKTIEVSRGKKFTIELAASNGSLAPEYRFSRLDPGIHGTRVRFVGRELIPPPPDRDGSAGRDRFEFEAVETGEIEIRFRRRPNRPDAPVENDQTCRVLVR